MFVALARRPTRPVRSLARAFSDVSLAQLGPRSFQTWMRSDFVALASGTAIRHRNLDRQAGERHPRRHQERRTECPVPRVSIGRIPRDAIYVAAIHSAGFGVIVACAQPGQGQALRGLATP